jgi:hypothetical protein
MYKNLAAIVVAIPSTIRETLRLDAALSPTAAVQ